MARSWGLASIVLLAALVAPATMAAAHENKVVGAGPVVVPAGGALRFPVEVHYHRIVGTVEAADGNARLALRADGPGGRTLLAEPAATLRVNALVACCEGVGWAEHTIVLDNPGTRPVPASVRLVALHDGLVVSALDVESGAALSILIFAGAPPLLALRTLRKGRLDEPARPWVLRSGFLLVSLWGLAAAITVPPLVRYGGGLASAVTASAADLPWTTNPIVTTADLLVLALVATWITTLVLWAKAARRNGSRSAVRALGLALGAGAILAGVSWAIDSPSAVVPLASGALAAALPLGWTAWTFRAASAREVVDATEPAA